MGRRAKELPAVIQHLANSFGSNSCPRDNVCVSVCDKNERAAVKRSELREEFLVVVGSSVGAVVMRGNISSD